MEETLAINGVLVDSDVVIEVLRRRNPGVEAQWTEVVASGAMVLYSPVSAAEIWHGLRPAEAGAVETVFSGMTCVPIDAEIGRKAGEYLRRFRASHGLDLGDALIAATAAVHQVPLWTRNRKHYPMRDVRLV